MPLTAENVYLREKVSELEENITNLRRLEATIARNEDLFEALLCSTKTGIVLVNAEGVIIRVVCGILGYSLESLSGSPIADLVHPEDRDGVRECYRYLVRNRKRKVRGEARFRKADGSYTWLEFTVTDMLDDPSVMALVHSHHDVSALRRGRLADAELAALTADTNTCVFSVDPQGVIRTWHSPAERLLGYSRQEVEGISVECLFPPALQAEDRARRAAVMETGERSALRATELVRRDGQTIAVHLTLAPLAVDHAIQAVSYIVRTIDRESDRALNGLPVTFSVPPR